MSGRTFARFVLLGLFSLLAAVPLGAQNPNSAPYSPQTTTPTTKPMSRKLAGTWYRKVDGLVVATTFADDEL